MFKASPLSSTGASYGSSAHTGSRSFFLWRVTGCTSRKKSTTPVTVNLFLLCQELRSECVFKWQFLTADRFDFNGSLSVRFIWIHSKLREDACRSKVRLKLQFSRTSLWKCSPTCSFNNFGLFDHDSMPDDDVHNYMASSISSPPTRTEPLHSSTRKR